MDNDPTNKIGFYNLTIAEHLVVVQLHPYIKQGPETLPYGKVKYRS